MMSFLGCGSNNSINNIVSPHVIQKSNKMAQKSRPKVFLGGACNPTTWRRDIAIPFLIDAGTVDFYNPQVDTWSADLMDKEDAEKESAEVLLFVFTHDTRGQATLVEAAYYIGKGRDVVLVLDEYNPEQTISIEEKKDMNRGRVYLREMAKLNKIVVCDTIHNAMVEVLKKLLKTSL